MSSEKTEAGWRFRTIGTRLTLWGAGITLALCTLLSLVLYAGLSVSLYHAIDTFLDGEVHEFMVTVNAHPDDDAGLERAIRRELGSRARRDLAFRLFDRRGRLIVSSERDDAIARVWRAPADWDGSPPHMRFETVQPPGRRCRFRTCSLRVQTKDGRAATAQASYTLDRTDASLAMFRRVCAIGLALTAVLSLVTGRMLAARSLQPVRTVTETAERIGAESLGDRIPLTGTGDELDRLAATLNSMLERIERHVRQIRQFTADASHELRSPLAALRGAAEVALSKPRTAEELRRVLEDSIEHYNRLARVAEDLLLLARADAGFDVVRRGLVRLDEAVGNVVDLYAPLAQEQGIELTFRQRHAVTLEADGARLRQLVGNLIDNAIKFTSAGGRISVSLTNGEQQARIIVADTGIGIPADHLPRVLDRFYRVDPARSARRGGAGLGLPICRAIARAHGGTIDIRSRFGAGTTVTVCLPLAASTTETMGPRQPRPGASGAPRAV